MPTISSAHFSQYRIIVVGSGFFGSTIARLFVDKFSKPVLVIEKRNHVGGNAWSEIDKETRIEFHKYGSHLFHTSSERVWKFVTGFSEFNDYRHSVVAKHKDKFFPIPINLLTLSQFYGRAFTPIEAKELFETFRAIEDSSENQNFEAAAIKSIGKELYEAFFEGYTRKQWQVSPRSLPRETFGRIPIRLNFNSRYFSDKYEGLPIIGYGNLFNKILDNEFIDVILNTDYFTVKQEIPENCLVIYTGALDRFFEFKFGNLGWRTLDFALERVDVNDFQGTSVVNYPDPSVAFTRIHEFKHLHPERSYDESKTLIMREYPRQSTPEDEPYYPINSLDDREKLKEYRKLAELESNFIFGGRLGSYQYLDMHMAIASAFSTFEAKIEPRFA